MSAPPSSAVVSAKPSPSYSTDLADCADGVCEVLPTTSYQLVPHVLVRAAQGVPGLAPHHPVQLAGPGWRS